MCHFNVSVQITPGRLDFSTDITLGPALVEGSVVLQAVGGGEGLATGRALERFLLKEAADMEHCPLRSGRGMGVVKFRCGCKNSERSKYFLAKFSAAKEVYIFYFSFILGRSEHKYE